MLSQRNSNGKPERGGKKERRKMADAEYLNFLQQLRDLEDFSRQREIRGTVEILNDLKRLARKHKMTWEQWKATVGLFPDCKGKAILDLIEQWENEISK